MKKRSLYTVLVSFFVFSATFTYSEETTTGAKDVKSVSTTKNITDSNIDLNLFADSKDLYSDISTLNLINGLNLSVKQMEGLLDIVKEAKVKQDLFYTTYNELAKKTNESYETLIQGLIVKGQEVDTALQQSTNELHKKLKEANEAYEADMKAMESKLCGVLFAGQIEIVSTFKQCLIPPKTLRNPTRVGQAYDSGPMENLLKNLRNVKPKMYEQKVNQAVEKIILHEEEKYLGKLSTEEREKEQYRLLAIIKKSKAMSDADFELHKEELAQEMDMKYLQNQARITLNRLSKANEGIGKVGKYFLNPRIIPMLEKKIELAKNYTKPQVDNLGKIEQAEQYNKIP